jgi:uncharacterized hydrophobic protein (TIGR00271 family)
VKGSLLPLLSLRRDQQDADVVDASLRAGAQAGGTNLWVLFFAILIASVGLNVNSTAVIIGAMLISPLMGPIVGVGYGAAVGDFALIRTAAKSLAAFTAISLGASTLYFWLSPLDVPQSELLARTSPTLWDVLIAAFGGAAGMVAATRRTFTNIAPGVAIATALMPPLCTTGFGIAHGRWDMVAGAFFLFLINGVFIAAASLAMAKVLRLPNRASIDERTRSLHRRLIGFGLTAVLLPSVWLSWRFVQHEIFTNVAQGVARAMEAEPTTNLLAHEIDADARTLRLTLVGGGDEAKVVARAQALLGKQGVHDATVTVHRAGQAQPDVGRLRREISNDLRNGLVTTVQAYETRLQALERSMAAAAAAAPRMTAAEGARLADEIRAQYAQISSATVGVGVDSAGQERLLVSLSVLRPLKPADRERLQRWLEVRADGLPLILSERLAAGARVIAQR